LIIDNSEQCTKGFVHEECDHKNENPPTGTSGFQRLNVAEVSQS